MKILFVGDVYGKTGREVLSRSLPILIEKNQPDWVIVNGENATAGNGLSDKHARQIKSCGAHIITSGNHIFARPDWQQLLTKEENILRPHNLVASSSPGSGVKIFAAPGRPDLAVFNIAGRVFMSGGACPFRCFDELYQQIPPELPLFVDFHAEATSEKLAFFWHVDGRASAVAGTHTHVQTSDARILPGGTAVITDAGMTGALNGVIGVDRETILSRFTRGYSNRFQCAGNPAKIEGVIVVIGPNKKAQSIEAFRESDDQG